MNTWPNDPRVVNAVADFESARQAWLDAKAAASDGTGLSSALQEAAYFRMRAADRAYLWTRDAAIVRDMSSQPSNDRNGLWAHGLREPHYVG
jgi:hypothetical protein